ncbi:MAG: helix-turn-helix transcriptional regulator [Henriciella sp.]
MTESKSPSGIDRIVGQRLRWRRRELKLTQEQLGEKLGLTFQQVQKYEKGVNRISAGRLFEVADVLAVAVSYFYEGVEDMLGHTPSMVRETDQPPALPHIDSEAIELVTAFQRITDAGLRRSLLDTIKAAGVSAETDKDS